ncbi:MAG: hypothetical protein LBD92_07355 [Oscillospiraceae bacterium]|jgi:hypothetical protein|nr:hypothetical protein [Oscillospiraceae bacterium]
MPRKDRLNVSRQGRSPEKKKDFTDRYICFRCGRTHMHQKSNFPASQSPLYRHNNGYLSVCKLCVDEMFENYLFACGSEEAALRQICLKFDIYWLREIYEMTLKAMHTNSRVLCYIMKTNMTRFLGKSYDDTINDERHEAEWAEKYGARQDEDRDKEDKDGKVSRRLLDFWGGGFAPDFYKELQRRFNHWTSDYEGEITIEKQGIIRQICISEAAIARDVSLGKNVAPAQNSLVNLLGSANLKPVQKEKDVKADDSNQGGSLGLYIRQIEDERPIEPDPEFADVDNVRELLQVWYAGHIARVVNAKGYDLTEYRDAIEPYTANQPSEFNASDEDLSDE